MKNLKPGHSRPTVCLDPGHDKAIYNRSKVVPEYYEGQRMWDLCCLLKSRLEELGMAVIVTKTKADQAVSLSSRGKKSQNADLFISLHSNAASTQKPDWVTILHQVEAPGETDARSREFARIIGAAVADAMKRTFKLVAKVSSGDRDRDGYLDDYYGVLRSAHQVGTPGVIIEHGFHTNADCASWLLKDSNLEKLADAETAAIAGWFAMAEYSLDTFVREVQAAIGAKVDGRAGAETIGKTVTLSAKKNCRHGAVKPVQKRLAALGYSQVGEADGFAGVQFTAAVTAFQMDNWEAADGEITAGYRTWRALLGMEA